MTTRKDKKIKSIGEILREYGIKDENESENKDSNTTPEERVTKLASALNKSDLADLKANSSEPELLEIGDGDFNEFNSVNDDESVDVYALLQEVDALKKRVEVLINITEIITHSFMRISDYVTSDLAPVDKTLSKLKEN